MGMLENNDTNEWRGAAIGDVGLNKTMDWILLVLLGWFSVYGANESFWRFIVTADVIFAIPFLQMVFTLWYRRKLPLDLIVGNRRPSFFVAGFAVVISGILYTASGELILSRNASSSQVSLAKSFQSSSHATALALALLVVNEKAL